MTTLTQKERDALGNLPHLAAIAMRSKPTLKLLGKMQERGLIEFHPFEGKAFVTGLGHKALADGVSANAKEE